MPLSDCTNALSVDLEDWYQAVTSLNAHPESWPAFEMRVVENTRRLLSLLDEYQLKVTFFVLGRVADDHPDLIREIDRAGHEIGIHGYSHRMIHHLTQESFAQEIERSLSAVAPLINQAVIGHRAPYFSINRSTLWALEVLHEKGFRYDSSFFPTRNMLYGYPDAPRTPHRPDNCGLIEFPLSTVRWGPLSLPIAGGFYLRLYPYAMIRRSILRLNRAGQPLCMYMHPWELDVAHRYNHVTPREWIVQYTGRRGLEPKLRRLFVDFKFAPFRDLLHQLKV